MKKMLAIMLIVAIAVFSPVCSMAEDIFNYYTTTAGGFFASYNISLTKAGTTIHIAFRTTAVETMDQLGVLSYDVQRLVSGTWTTVADDVTGSIGSDTAFYSFSRNYSAASGYSYRVKAKYYAKKYDGTSTSVTMTSSSISV